MNYTTDCTNKHLNIKMSNYFGSKFCKNTLEHETTAILKISSGKETQKSWRTTQKFRLPKLYLAHIQFFNSLATYTLQSKLTMYRLKNQSLCKSQEEKSKLLSHTMVILRRISALSHCAFGKIVYSIAK